MMNRKRLLTMTLGCVVAMTINANLAYADPAPNANKRASTVKAQLPAYYPSHFPSLGVVTDMRDRSD